MTWIIRLPDGRQVESDDFTLDDLDRTEKATGVPWATFNPWRDAKVCREFLRTAYLHLGMPQEDADAAVAATTLRDAKRMFDYRPDDTDGDSPGGGGAAPLDRRRPSSSRGARTGTGGPPPSPGRSASETSST